MPDTLHTIDWLQSIHHDGSPLFLSNPTPSLGERITLRLRCHPNAQVKAVYLRTAPDGEQSFTPMTLIEDTRLARWWQVEITMSEPRVLYRFVLVTPGGLWHYSAAGLSQAEPLDASAFRLVADYAQPAWVRSAVFYQIFPDRFANGSPADDPRPQDWEIRGARPRTFPWGSPPDPGTPFSMVFYGGDLPGILQRLDYLQSLGVDALYLNPVFTARSNHRYDVVDYTQVDPYLGGDQALIRLADNLHARSMRYILDIVPNHCGFASHWFQTAQRDPSSPEAGFFTFLNYPDEYATWLGVWSLPKLNYTSHELRWRMYEAPDAIFRRWLLPPFSADGWRVDVANMLARQGPLQSGDQIARGIRSAVKHVNPQAYLIGENFFDATPQLQGDQWDGVMNYAGFTIPLEHWLNQVRYRSHGLNETISVGQPLPTRALLQSWRQRRAGIPWAIAVQQYNQLDSHDTSRILSTLGGNPRLHRLAIALQFTYPGVPGVYYGDEIGLADHPQLASRGCMPWDPSAWDQSLLAFYRALIKLRKQSPALQSGSFQEILEENDAFAYLRESPQAYALVVAQRSPTPRPAGGIPLALAGVPDGVAFTEFFSGERRSVQDGMLMLPEHPQGASIWLAGKPA